MATIRLFLILFVFALTGCASLEKSGSAGFQVQAEKDIIHKRQEPWHNLTLVGDVRKAMTYQVVFVPLPNPLPLEWKQELVDKDRTYVVKMLDGTQIRKPLERVVFRAIVYQDEQYIEMFDALLNPSVTGFFVLLPPGGEYEGMNLAIVSSDATWLMTTRSEIVLLPEKQGLEKLPQGFFSEHHSRVTRVVRMNRGEQSGENFFADIEALFPRHISVGGFSYSGRPDTKIVAGKFTRVDSVTDRVISCGALTVQPDMMTVGVIVSLARNIYVAGKSDCFK